MIGVPLGLLYANAVEWVAHRYVLHGLGKKKKSIWSFHWAKHHKTSRRHEMYDPEYHRGFFDWDAGGKEALAIGALVAVHAPLAPIAPWFTATLCYSGINYLYKHRRCHIDVEWGRQHMPHHYDHHMGRDQEANWCVTQPWFDWIMGTRKRYAFTADERIPEWVIPHRESANDAADAAA